MLPDTEEFLIAAFGRGYRKANLAKARHLLDANPELAKASVFDAAAAGDLGALSGFIQAGPRAAVNPGGIKNGPPLVYAASSILGSPACVAMLLENGADPNSFWLDPACPEAKLSCLYGAAGMANHPEIAELLLKHGANPNDGESLYHSTEFRDHKCLRLLLAHGAKFEGTNALAHMLDYDDLDGLRICLDNGADPNPKPPELSPLHHAIIRGRSADFVRLLIDRGALPKRVDCRGLTPYRLARLTGATDVAQLLEGLGAAESLTGADEFVAACAAADHEIARALQVQLLSLPSGMLRLLPDQASRGRFDSVALMLELGWPAAAAGDWGGSALNHACYRGDLAMVRLLLSHGAKASEPNNFGGNALGAAYYASENDPQPGGKYEDVIKLLAPLASGS